MTLALMAVRQEVNNFESSVVVQEVEFAMNLALYGLLKSLGNSLRRHLTSIFSPGTDNLPFLSSMKDLHRCFVALPHRWRQLL